MRRVQLSVVARSSSARLAAFGVIAILTTTACKRSSSGDASKQTGSVFVSKMLDRLKSPDVATRQAAIDELRKQALKLSPAVGIELLEATTQPFPESDELREIPTQIVTAVCELERVEYVPVIENLFPRWKDASAREAALETLSTMNADDEQAPGAMDEAGQGGTVSATISHAECIRRVRDGAVAHVSDGAWPRARRDPAHAGHLE